jgi:hypothetical protein
MALRSVRFGVRSRKLSNVVRRWGKRVLEWRPRLGKRSVRPGGVTICAGRLAGSGCEELKIQRDGESYVQQWTVKGLTMMKTAKIISS